MRTKTLYQRPKPFRCFEIVKTYVTTSSDRSLNALTEAEESEEMGHRPGQAPIATYPFGLQGEIRCGAVGASTNIVQPAPVLEKAAPNIKHVYWYWRIDFSVIHRKRSAAWSFSVMLICINLASISAITAIGHSRKRSRRRNKFWSKRLSFNDCPRKGDVAFAIRRTFPGFFGLHSG